MLVVQMNSLNFIVGDMIGNLKQIIDACGKNFSHVHGSKLPGERDVISVFSELAITGYPPLDLIERRGFFEEQMFCLGKIAEQTIGKANYAIIVGFFEKNNGQGKPFYNSLAFCADGKVQYIYRKQLLPTYDIFDESRYFEPGDKQPFYEWRGHRIGLLICEDCWNDKHESSRQLYKVDPLSQCMLHSPSVIITINASPEDIGKDKRRNLMYQNLSDRYNVPIYYCNQVGANDEIVFTKTSTVFEPKNQEFESVVEKNDMHSILRILLMGIKDYCEKLNINQVVVGCSGGIDSALVLALAKLAGIEKIIAITMPSAISSKGSVDDSIKLCKNLGIPLLTCPISSIFDASIKAQQSLGTSKSLTKENLQARIRAQILLAFTNEHGGMVLTTGNKSECAVGYCTYGGDTMGGLAPIADLYKTEVFKLCKYINEIRPSKETSMIPLEIIDKEPSAELYEGQKDSDSLPSYEVLDAVLKLYIEGEFLSVDELVKYKEIVAKSKVDVNKIHRMVDNAEFKRRQYPPTIRLRRKSWGFGRRLPIVQKYN